MKSKTILTAAVLVTAQLALFAPTAEAGGGCANSVTWPSVSPVWEFCFRAPNNSTPAGNGSGLEIYDVKWKGTTILKTAHIPILNVRYAPNGCFGDPCYRDWFDENRRFDCAPSSGGICTGTSTPASTVCNNPGSDSGSFSGVAVEDFGTSLRLTAQTAAGWYRYIPWYEFYADGRIEARASFTAVDHPCEIEDHNHHAYWRFDFDINETADNWVDEVVGVTPTRVATEKSWVDTSPARSQWIVGSNSSGLTVEVTRNAGDQGAGDPLLVPNDFPMADGWVLAYKSNELTDFNGFSTNPSVCRANLDDFDTNESVNGTDIVLWVHAGSFHESQPGGDNMRCTDAGPTLRVIEGPMLVDGFETGDTSRWTSETQ
ncbi:MAG: hypothetical protein AAF604_21595 [Acidobacteriota bacterium]